MLGKIIGAGLGSKLAQSTKGMGGTTGAILGAAAPIVLKRLSLPAMAVLGVGGYFAKKYYDKQQANKPVAPEVPAKTTPPVASIPQPKTAAA